MFLIGIMKILKITVFIIISLIVNINIIASCSSSNDSSSSSPSIITSSTIIVVIIISNKMAVRKKEGRSLEDQNIQKEDLCNKEGRLPPARSFADQNEVNKTHLPHSLRGNLSIIPSLVTRCSPSTQHWQSTRYDPDEDATKTGHFSRLYIEGLTGRAPLWLGRGYARSCEVRRILFNRLLLTLGRFMLYTRWREYHTRTRT